jgi:hypothetical protein
VGGHATYRGRGPVMPPFVKRPRTECCGYVRIPIQTAKGTSIPRPSGDNGHLMSATVYSVPRPYVFRRSSIKPRQNSLRLRRSW